MPLWSTPVMQASSKDPLEIVARLDRLYATESSSKRKKTIELAGNMIGEVIKANLRHTMVAERHRNFYNIVEEILRLKKAYASLQLPECRSSKISVAFTIVDYTATTLAIVSEAVPMMAPGKAAAVALAKIAELAKTAQGNKDEALRLSKHAEDARKRLLKRLDGAKNLPPEALAEIGEDIQLLQSVLDDILSALRQLQKPTRNRVKAFLFAKDHKDELGQLQKKLDDGFRAFSANNGLALRIDVSRLQSEVSNLAKAHSQPISLAVGEGHYLLDEIPKSSSPRKLLMQYVRFISTC
ncbi:hypothetical protein Moror_13315 [Moniliophthora roreri MCA 2997]|uniref:Uncharacterized protein n=1 Tax=Moniliophthora roreri (strain MCA 2997) TaxID=1381753 RepID=V2XZ34_MONRO|nr:hypothetical protein Moror_13315 [Moniliophthora roreri MCA 2997]